MATPRSSRRLQRLSRYSPIGRLRHDRGAAMVEFALILPILCSLVLGMVTGGAAYNRKLSMTNAVREGARFGATLEGTSGSTWTAAVRQRTDEMAGTDLNATDVCVELVKNGAVVSGYSLYGSGANACTAAEAPSITTSAGQCVVKVWTKKQTKLQAMFFTAPIDLKASAAARQEAVAGTCT